MDDNFLINKLTFVILRTAQLPDKMDDKFDDLVFTEDQLRFIDQLFADSQAEVGHSNKRQKRKVINFGDPGIPFNKWETTNIHYMIDGTQSKLARAIIRCVTKF